jgi:NAD(P)-dependent dehydrogenase (short-subunit alcohol dehydrogenase family)
LNVFAGVRKQ